MRDVLIIYGSALAGVFIFALLVYAITAFFLMKIFEKAGVEDGWRAWVPVYNYMIFFKLGDLSPWLVLYGIGGAILLSWIGIGFIFSIALYVFSALAAYRIGMKFGKDSVWVVLYVFVAVVWMGILAFDKARWNPNIPPAGWADNAFLADRTVWEGVPGPAVTGETEIFEA